MGQRCLYTAVHHQAVSLIYEQFRKMALLWQYNDVLGYNLAVLHTSFLSYNSLIVNKYILALYLKRVFFFAM